MVFNWTTQEEIDLTIAFIYVSMDEIVGSAQKTQLFWTRIREIFIERNGNPYGRDWKAIKKKMKAIKKEVKVFLNIMNALYRQEKSGANHEDLAIAARLEYQSEYNQPFRYDACYELFREKVPGFNYELTVSQNSELWDNHRNFVGVEDGTEILANGETRWRYKENARPIGQKKAKEQARQKKDRQQGIYREGDEGTSSVKMQGDMIIQQNNSILEYLKETRIAKEKMRMEQQSQYQSLWGNVQAPMYEMEGQINLQTLHQQTNLIHQQQGHLDDDNTIMSLDLSQLQPNEKKYYLRKQKEILKGKGIISVVDSEDEDVVQL